jgi:hypothetical protein
MIALRFAYLLSRQRAAFIGKGASTLIGSHVGNDYAKYGSSIRYKSQHISDRRDPEDQDDSNPDDLPADGNDSEIDDENEDEFENLPFHELEPGTESDFEDEDDDEHFDTPIVPGGGPRRYPDGASYVAQRFTVQPCEEDDGYDADPDLFRVPIFFDDEKVTIYAKHVLDPKKYSFEALSNETGASIDRIKGVISVMHQRYEMMRKKGFTVRIESLSLSQVEELIEKDKDQAVIEGQKMEDEKDINDWENSDSEGDDEDDSAYGSDGEKKKKKKKKGNKRNDFDRTKGLSNDEEFKAIFNQPSSESNEFEFETLDEKVARKARKEQNELKEKEKETKKLSKAVNQDKDILDNNNSNDDDEDDDGEDELNEKEEEIMNKLFSSFHQKGKSSKLDKKALKEAKYQYSLEKGYDKDYEEEKYDVEGIPLTDLETIEDGGIPKKLLENIPIIFVDIPSLWEEMFDFSEQDEFVGEEDEKKKDYKIIYEAYKNQIDIKKELQLPEEMTVEKFQEIIENMDDHYRRLSNVAERDRENLDTLDDLEEYGADIRFRETPIRQKGMSRHKRNVYKNYYPKLLNDDNYEQVKRTLEECVADSKLKLPEYDLNYYKMKYDADQMKKELPSFFPQTAAIRKGKRLAYFKSKSNEAVGEKPVDAASQPSADINEAPVSSVKQEGLSSSVSTDPPQPVSVREQQQNQEQKQVEDPNVRIVNPHRSNSETKPSRWKFAFRDLNKRVGSNIGDSSATIITRTGK